MDSLLMSIALRYGKGKLTDMGLNYAAKLLGIDQQEQNPKYTFGMPFTNRSIDPMNLLKRTALNTGAKSLISGGSAIAPLALSAGVVYLLNKNRKKLTGYDTQQAYEDARTERIADKRLDKITDRMVAGKNYGNYEEALLDSGAGAVNIDDTITYSSDYFPEPKKPAPAPAPVYQGGGGRDSGSTPSPSTGGYSYDSGGRQGFGYGLKKGGIASL